MAKLGISVSDMDEMTIGEQFDLIRTYNNISTNEQKEESEVKTATQIDFDCF